MKFFRYILFAILLLFVLSGGFVFANNHCDPACGAGLTCVGIECLEGLPEGPQSAGEVLDIIAVVSNWVFAIFLAIAVIFLVLGAFEFVTGEGNPEKVSSAKKRLLYAIIGIAIENSKCKSW